MFVVFLNIKRKVFKMSSISTEKEKLKWAEKDEQTAGVIWSKAQEQPFVRLYCILFVFVSYFIFKCCSHTFLHMMYIVLCKHVELLLCLKGFLQSFVNFLFPSWRMSFVSSVVDFVKSHIVGFLYRYTSLKKKYYHYLHMCFY